ncbi:hypothetical protein HOLleu_19116 [Holothuria leucospilota]|uniref:Uncharacterized protein n=1 Tax=Holothuria leucospilota TaxID=206669 RepID=A0A9Q1H9M4_HOLLE|nr:hypothetical protein HOLleu_19116 [Holothuria leucospilota]
MEPSAIVLGAQHKQWSRENKPVSHAGKKGRGRPHLNQLIRNLAVKPHLTLPPTVFSLRGFRSFTSDDLR